MQILILGATGRTGKHLLNHALQRGHNINVLARDRNKINENNSRLVLFEGTPLDKVALENAMKGCEAILSCLNISRVNDWPWSKLRSPTDFLSQTMRSIIDVAGRQHIQRVIFTSAWGVAETKKNIPAWFRWIIDHSNVRYPYLDHERQEELVVLTSLQWTAVRPAGLVNSAGKQDIIVSLNNEPRPKMTISRRSVAGFMLDVLEKNLYIRQKPVISAK